MDLRGVTEFLKDAAKYIITIIVVILIFIYIISIQQIVGPSMKPTLSKDDVVIVNKVYKTLSRGDIIVFEYDGMKNLVKRIVGMPGDIIEYKDNTLYINNQAYKEPYLQDNVVTSDFKLADINETKIPKEEYFVLGDNRENSMDSRKIGLIKKKDIIGRVGLRLYPFNKAGQVK